MKFILTLLVAAVATFALPQLAAAQTMDVSVHVSTPQGTEVGLEERSFGFTVAATYAYTQLHSNVHLLGSVQYHDHNRAQYTGGEIRTIEGSDRDLVAALGVRLTKWRFYVQGLAGYLQKRDAVMSKEKDTTPAGYIGWGVQPTAIGISGGWHFSDFGEQYSVGLNYRF